MKKKKVPYTSLYPSELLHLSQLTKTRQFHEKKKKKISNIDRTLSQPFFFFFFLGLIFSLGPYFHEKFPTESLVGDGDSTLFFSFFVRYWLCNGG